MTLEYRDVALIGLGASTQAAAEYLLGLPEDERPQVTVYTGVLDHGNGARIEGLRALGAEVIEDTCELSREYDLGIVSPGVPAIGGFYASARDHCRDLMSEPEFAWRLSPRDWVAVTGTNGKTTTTTLINDLLLGAGIPCRPVGNIGLPPIRCVADRADGEVFAAELSSFQLETTSLFAPRCAILLNITPDHVEWHGDLTAYARAKERVFDHMTTRDLCIIGDDEDCRRIAGGLEARGMRVLVIGAVPGEGTRDAAWLDEEGMLCVRLDGGPTIEVTGFAGLHLKGGHNLQNILAALAAVLHMGADPIRVADALRAFHPLAHRIEPCGAAAGVRYFDDSKATNTDAVIKAVMAFAPGEAIVLLGGHDKGCDLGELCDLVVRHCAGAVAYGEARGRFSAGLAAAAATAGAGSTCVLREAKGMRDAFEVARAMAAPGQAVLLSPACSSYDEFGGFAERGDVFQGLVRALPDYIQSI